MGELALIGVPTSAGTHGPGQEKAPQALREAGLVRGLEAAGVTVHDQGDLPPAMYQAAAADPRQRNLDGVAAVAGRVADLVATVLGRDLVPLVVGGDCTITRGVVAGFARHGADVGLLYFDGDADLSTPASTSSGVLDSRVVAHLLGEGAPGLTGLGPRVPLLAADRLLLFGFDDPDVTAAALLGAGQSRYRMDDEAGAIATWEAILELPESPSTYYAWREIAAARVRDGDLQGAIAAYREADRRAPLADKPEIANRLGWLAKETGNVRASRQRRSNRKLSRSCCNAWKAAKSSIRAWFGDSSYRVWPRSTRSLLESG